MVELRFRGGKQTVLKLITLIVLIQGTAPVAASFKRTVRLPLQRPDLVLKSPPYQPRVLRHDPTTGNPIYYNHKPRVVVIDRKTGKYALRWIGYDGREKTVVFQRSDLVDVVVSASVTKQASGKYLYVY